MRHEFLREINETEKSDQKGSLEDDGRVQELIDAKDRKELKTLIRQCYWPMKHTFRETLWKQLASVAGRSNEVYDEKHEIDVQKFPKFVDPMNVRFYYLNKIGQEKVSRVLWSLYFIHEENISFAPLLYPLCALFLHFMSPEDAHESLSNLLSSKDSHFIGTSLSDKSRDAFVLVKLTGKFGVMRPKNFCAEARGKLRDSTIDAAFAEYLQWIFIALPFQYCMRIVDCFLIEGDKFLFRVALALALLYDRHHPQTPLTLVGMYAFCERITEHVPTPQHLINAAVRLTRISRNKISKQKIKAEQRLSICKSELIEVSKLCPKNDMFKDVVIKTRIAPRSFRPSLLTWSQLDDIWEWIPDRCIPKTPIVVYSSDENGNSLTTFYRHCGDHQPTMLIIKTLENEVFGAFLSTAWSRRFESSKKGQSYFGTGECFLFTVLPKMERFQWVGKLRENVSHSEQLFMAGDSKMIGIGSGSGNWGLLLDENLTKGQTNSCPTFNNKPLSKSNDFIVAVVEVIAFVES